MSLHTHSDFGSAGRLAQMHDSHDPLHALLIANADITPD
jgi:hypothetical protein